MINTAIIRCEKNMDKCPLTSCFAALSSRKGAFQIHHEDCAVTGIFTCHCPGDNVVEMANILKNKGAEVIHFCTCAFATKGNGGWSMENGGFCKGIDEIIERVHNETGIPCVKGTAHLPKDYTIQKWD